MITRLRLLIIDDFEPWTKLVQSLLSDVPLLHVVGIVHDGHSVLESVQKLNPDLILLDVNLATTNGIDLLRTLRSRNPEIKVIFVSQNSSLEVITSAFEAGACGYVLKTEAIHDLLPAIEVAQAGKEKRYLSKSLRKSFPEF